MHMDFTIYKIADTSRKEVVKSINCFLLKD